MSDSATTPPRRGRGRFNLSDWALRHRSMVWYLIIVSLLAGAMSYVALGREEDPSFTIKTMVVSASLPGATVQETLSQVTDRIERKLEELDALDTTRSITTEGQAVVYVDLLPTTRAADISAIWQEVRNLMNDIAGDFPSEFRGFRFNDDFGDVFGNIYAFTADGFTPREMRDRLDDIRTRIQDLEQAGKVDLIGMQDEVIYLDFSTRRLAALGLSKGQVVQTLQAQNAIAPSGAIDARGERILVRVGGQFGDASDLARINLRVGDRFFPLSDVASVSRGYVDPPETLFRFEGKPAYGLAIGMVEGGNILDFAVALNDLMAEIAGNLPVGIEIYHVADQPGVVTEAVGEFVRALVEAVLIVLAVSFVSLGLRAGLVVTMTIPLVLAITFVILDYTGVTLQRVSLGALIIALGLLVDDAMIAIETMISRLEIGESMDKAASYAWSSIAFPMLTGTLATVAGFIPIGLNNSAAGEFTFSLFVVIAVSLVVSWIVAVLFAPVLGATFLAKKLKHQNKGPGRMRRTFQNLLQGAMRFRLIVVFGTVVLFGASLWGMQFVQQQFFPTSDRPELVIDIGLRQNASIEATRETMDRLETHLTDQKDDLLFWTSYVGRGAPRFILSYDVPTSGPFMGQIVIQTPGLEARDRLRAELTRIAENEFPGADILIKYLEIGPPVGKPVQYRIAGKDIAMLREAARDLAALLSQDTRLAAISLDWSEPARTVRVEILQDRARQLGLSPKDIADTLDAIYDGQLVTQIRDDTYLVDVVGRGDEGDRGSIDALTGLQIMTPQGAIALRSLATLSYGIEPPLIRQKDGLPTITVKASIATGDQPETIVNDLSGSIAAFRATLPEIMTIEVGGTVETSAESQAPIFAVVPLMLFIMVTLVMVQMQGFRASFVVLSVAPLALIGVVLALLLSGAPLGFVAILGVLALIGILIRNSLILVNEVQTLFLAGQSRWDAVFNASDSRTRPILLTAAAASLALIPISRQVFWGPMAYAMMGGIIVGTLITLLFVPALYCMVYRVERPDPV